AEMDALAAAAGCAPDTMLYLACEYEAWMEKSRGGEKCTGFIAANAGTPDPGLLMGQTNDEDPAAWLGGGLDLVVHRSGGADPDSLIYTHPGVPAYMGINAAGLVVQWQYIDTGERNLEAGLPTTVLIFEMLRRETLADAVAWLRETPRACPNNYQLGRPSEGAVNIECTPSHFSLQPVEAGCACHANHITGDLALQAADVGVTRTQSTSLKRLAAIEATMAPIAQSVSVDQALQALSHPPVNYERTLAAMLFQPKALEMRIQFAGQTEFTRHRL
ncbi:MAG: C45 family autoproteolytic acyltransferase/hydrolase, partial [Rhodospirillaceae bacterium]